MADDFLSTTSTAGQIAVGGSATGNIEVANDHDWFRVSLVAGNIYTIKQQGSPSGKGTLTDTYLALYNSSGTQLNYNDEYGGTHDSQITFKATTSDFYYVDAGAYLSLTGTYTISVAAGGDPSQIDDYSAGTNTIGIVSVGETATGSVEKANDEDWFKVTLTAGTAYLFTEKGAVSGNGTLQKTILTLYDASGNYIKNDYPGNSESHLAYRPTTSGTYYLDAGGSQGMTGTYTIGASVITGGAPTGSALINGVAQKGQALTVNTSSIQDSDGLGPFTINWQSSTDNGATWATVTTNQSAYYVVAADVNNLVRAEVTYKDGQGLQEFVYSAPTSKIQNAAISGFHINLIADDSVKNAPAGFAAAVRKAADIYEQLFSDNITLNISYGWGTLNGTVNNGIPNGGLSYSYGTYGNSYADVKSWLNGEKLKTPDDLSATSSLPTTSPYSSNYYVSYAQLKALGHYTGDGRGLDGSIDIGVQSSSSYWLALALHEIGHSLGRVDSATNGTSILSLYRYTAQGVYDSGGLDPAYFSIDGGKTKLANFGTVYTSSDFNNSGIQGNDLFSERVANLSTLTALDLRTMDVLGFDLASFTPVLFNTVNNTVNFNALTAVQKAALGQRRKSL